MAVALDGHGWCEGSTGLNLFLRKALVEHRPCEEGIWPWLLVSLFVCWIPSHCTDFVESSMTWLVWKIDFVDTFEWIFARRQNSRHAHAWLPVVTCGAWSDGWCFDTLRVSSFLGSGCCSCKTVCTLLERFGRWPRRNHACGVWTQPVFQSVFSGTGWLSLLHLISSQPHSRHTLPFLRSKRLRLSSRILQVTHLLYMP